MEADDLDNLIADSLGGVQAALESEKKAPPPAPKPASEVASAAASSGAASQSSINEPLAGAEDFLQKFMKSFDGAVGSDADFEKQLTQLMTQMLSNDLMSEPLQQVVSHLEPWLKSQKSLPAEDRKRYEAQLKTYKQILAVYKSNPDPLPDIAREQVQRLLQELQALGQPPEEVLRQMAPKEAEEGEESFEDFMKQMGLDANLGAAEQDLLKKLSEDPEELTKVMKDMAEGLPEEACKQQ